MSKRIHTKVYVLAILFVCLLISCSNHQPNLLQSTTRNNLHKVRLGESKYFLELPEYFEITEARGKEGQLGYNILPKDTSSKMLGFIEIEHGEPIGETKINWGTLKEKLQSTLLNQQTFWIIYQTETGYFVAENETEEISARVSSDMRSEIDSLISVIATLEKK